MGYRSDVAYKIQFYEKDRFIAFLTEAKLDPKTQKCFEDGQLEIDEDKLWIRFFCDYVKWYEGYEDVDCHEALLKKASEHIDLVGIPEGKDTYVCWWLFYRIGEELEDIDERHGGDPDWDQLGVARSLEINW